MSKKNDNDDGVDSRIPLPPPVWLPRLINFLHLIYCIAIIYIIHIIAQSTIDIGAVISLLIAIPLTVDNLRYTGLLLPFPQGVIVAASKLCFFSHEAITPLGLLYIPIIFKSYFPAEGSLWSLWLPSSVVSLGLAYKGLQRFRSMFGWKMETSNGISTCRPSHTSHAALIPIFMQVIGLIVCSGYVCWVNHHRSMDHPLAVLFVSQLIVFLGNGAIGPKKLLMSLFGNAFEVLWLWSIVQALVLTR
jgi:hypothetical protein